MPEWMSNWLPPFFSSCAVAVLASWVTVRLSIKRFRAERWWDRKYEAYSRIMQALHDWKRCCEHEIARETVEHFRSSEAYERELNERRNESAAELRKLMDMGSFILSKDATDELDRLRKREPADWRTDGLLSVYETDLEACSECLERIIPIARRDLGLCL